ncbi:MAG: zinc ribbon domain-containing protein [Candidatus Hydrogenedentota bacterium]
MALIQCPDCGKEVSDGAKACPNCGCKVSWEVAKGKARKKKPLVKNVFVWVFVLFLVAAVSYLVSPIIYVRIQEERDLKEQGGTTLGEKQRGESTLTPEQIREVDNEAEYWEEVKKAEERLGRSLTQLEVDNEAEKGYFVLLMSCVQGQAFEVFRNELDRREEGLGRSLTQLEKDELLKELYGLLGYEN